MNNVTQTLALFSEDGLKRHAPCHGPQLQYGSRVLGGSSNLPVGALSDADLRTK